MITDFHFGLHSVWLDRRSSHFNVNRCVGGPVSEGDLGEFLQEDNS